MKEKLFLTESSSPEQVGHATEGSGDSEDDGVVVEFGHTVMVQQDTGVGINIGPGVLDFTEVLKDGGNDVVDGLAKFDEGIVLDVFNGEFSLMDISGVSVSKDGMTITGNDLSGTEGSLGEFLDLFSGDVVTEFSLRIFEFFLKKSFFLPSSPTTISRLLDWRDRGGDQRDR